jgi:hypothetical protein
MASIIRIKRSTTSGDPSTLGNGELAYSALSGTQSNGGDRLYIGIGSETAGNAANHFVVGGKYFTDLLDHQHGTVTASSALIVDANKKLDELNVDNLTLNTNTLSSTDANGNIYIDPNGTGYVQIVGTNGLVIPVGTNLQQGPAVQGAIRYNTDTSSFEGYSGTTWGSLGGVKSVDQLTYITAESTPGASDDTLSFVTNGTERFFIDTDSAEFDSTVVVRIDSTTTSTSSSSGALVVSGGVGIGENLYVGGNINVTGGLTVSGAQTLTGDFGINGGDLYSTSTTFNLLNRDDANSVTEDGPTTVNAFLGATSVNIAANSGTTTVNNNLNVKLDADVDGNLNVDGTAQIDGATTIGAAGTRAALTVYGTTVSIVGTDNTTMGINAATASNLTYTLQADNTVGDANLDINVKNAATLDATSISLDATESSNLTVTANSGSNHTLTIDSSNSGAGLGLIAIGSTNTDEINVTSGDQVNVDAPDVNVGADTFDIVGKSTADAAVTITGSLDVDSIKIDGRTISSTDAANQEIIIDPYPAGGDNGGTVIIKGNLQVDGTTTTVNSTQVTIDDPIFTLGGDTVPIADDNLDRGIKFNWHNGSDAKVGFFGYDDSAAEYVFISDATEASNTFSPATANVFGNLRAGKLALKDTTASTSYSTGALIVDGGVGIAGQLNVDGAVNKFTGTTASTSITTGTVVVSGGVGVAGSVYLGVNLIGSGAATSDLDGFNIDGGTY